MPGLRAWVGYKNAVVYYDRQDRLAGDGKLSFCSRIKYAMDAITSFSYKPLRLCFVMSCLFLSMVAVLGVCSIFIKNSVDSVGLGIAAAVFLVGGALFFCLGVLGEYLGRVYDEVRNRPISIINDVYYAPSMVATQIRKEYEPAALNLDQPETEPLIAFKMRVG